MIKAVLLDLDHTLAFGPDSSSYFAFQTALDAHYFADYGPTVVPVTLRAALDALASKRDMMTANADVMIGSIARDLAMDVNVAEELIEASLASARKDLRHAVVADPCAYPLVDLLLREDVLVAICGNLIFPEVLIRQGLAWNGLFDFLDSFAFVSHGENMHFSKSHPAYYAELVARIGVEPDEALLIAVGQDLNRESARTIGLHIWHDSSSGALRTAFEHVQSSSWQHVYPAGPLEASMLLPQYQGNLAALYGLLNEAKPYQWLQKPDPDEWSILQILCHLAESELAVHQHRLNQILREDNPFISSPPPPGPDLPPCHDDGYEVLHQFHTHRQATMDLLQSLDAKDWQRPARHSIFGLTNLLEMACFTALHDRLHITQLCQTLGKCTETL